MHSIAPSILPRVSTVDQCVTRHARPPVIDNDGATIAPAPDAEFGSAAFVSAAGYAGRLLPQAIHDAIVDFTDKPHRTGAILLKNLLPRRLRRALVKILHRGDVGGPLR